MTFIDCLIAYHIRTDAAVGIDLDSRLVRGLRSYNALLQVRDYYKPESLQDRLQDCLDKVDSLKRLTVRPDADLQQIANQGAELEREIERITYAMEGLDYERRYTEDDDLSSTAEAVQSDA